MERLKLLKKRRPTLCGALRVIAPLDNITQELISNPTLLIDHPFMYSGLHEVAIPLQFQIIAPSAEAVKNVMACNFRFYYRVVVATVHSLSYYSNYPLQKSYQVIHTRVVVHQA